MSRTSFQHIFRSIKNPFLPSNFTIKSHLSSSDSFSPETINPFHHSILLRLQTCQSMTQLLQLQTHFIKSGFFQNPFPTNRILKLSLEFGDMELTISLLRHIDYIPNTFFVNEVINKTYSRSSNPDQAVVFYFEMLQKGFLPNSYTFTSLISCCKEMMMGSSRKATGQKCHGQVVKYNVDGVLQVQNSLIHMYASFGLVDSAWRVFDGMSTRDVVSWNSIVDGYVMLGELDGAHRLFDRMPIRNVVSWNIVISGYLEAGNPGCGLKLFREMVKTGLKGSERTVVSILTACGRSARLKEGRSVHGSLVKNFVKSSLIIDTALVVMYSKCKRVESAKRVFDGMVERNLVCWNAMIMGHCIHGCPEDGISLFEEMVGRGESKDGKVRRHNKSKTQWVEEQVILPDEGTFISVLCACARSGSLSKGRVYFNQMIDVYHIKPTFAHYWCMANLYAGAGFLQEAEKILMSMSMLQGDGDEEEEEEDRWLSSDSMLWGSLLGLCRFKGDVDMGEQIATRLIELEPHNSSWYMLLLNIYAAAGRWEDALKVMEMAKERGVRRKPSCSLFDLNRIVHEFKLGDF